MITPLITILNCPRLLSLAAIFWLCASFPAVSARLNPAQDQTRLTAAKQELTDEEKKHFLLTARIIRSRETPKGITRPRRLTLTDGQLTHDAAFQPVDEFKNRERLDNGTIDINFQDSYHFNIAAYQLAKLLGLGYMMPLTVERKWEGKTGSLSWWIDSTMDEATRSEKNIQAPDPDDWGKQMFRIAVFAELVFDTDNNATNVLIDEHWKLYMIDFTRAFRLREDLPHPKRLVRCDRQLLERLRSLDAAEIGRVTKPHLEVEKIRALMKRRDKIVDLFEKLIKEKGEAEVLY
jgi:hypothetical protein